QDTALTAKFADEFVELLEDLPEGREVVAALRPAAPAARGMSGPRAVASSGVSNQSLAILSGKDIVVPRGVTSYHLMSFLGGDNVDLTQAMGPGVVMIIEAQSVLGGSTITVPPGVLVIDEAQAVLGGNTVKRKAKGDGSNGTLVLRGIAILGGHTVKT
ncbi:MAG: cell wall-active antibiotics response protein, partial [Propionibacterium sp.]|nr:cell wall-active antibiotics response protein [Propionibacterium sp.]